MSDAIPLEWAEIVQPSIRQTMTHTFEKVADFTFGLQPDHLQTSTRQAAARMLLDTLGIVIGSKEMEAGRIARETAVALYSTGDPALSARLPLDGRRVSLAGAAYATATQTDNLDGHDGYNPTKGHIGVVVIPALLALAETLPDFSGPEALTAVTIGYEIAGRAGISLHDTVSDYHTSGAWNALGVVAMAARLRKMSADQLRQAMGIAEYHGPRSQMMREIANPTMLHDGSGWGAMVGLSSAILAEKGFTRRPGNHHRGRKGFQALGRSGAVLANGTPVRQTLSRLPVGPCCHRCCTGTCSGAQLHPQGYRTGSDQHLSRECMSVSGHAG